MRKKALYAAISLSIFVTLDTYIELGDWPFLLGILFMMIYLSSEINDLKKYNYVYISMMSVVISFLSFIMMFLFNFIYPSLDSLSPRIVEVLVTTLASLIVVWVADSIFKKIWKTITLEK